jgi:hypothetical protein
MHTYTTFFLDRKEIWISQPSFERYEEMITRHAKSHTGHYSTKRKTVKTTEDGIKMDKIWDGDEIKKMIKQSKSSSKF